MHARMITTQIALDRLDEGIKEWSAAQVAAMEQLGFQGNMLLEDRETGKFVVVSLWQSTADALESVTEKATIEYLEVAASNGAPEQQPAHRRAGGCPGYRKAPALARRRGRRFFLSIHCTERA